MAQREFQFSQWNICRLHADEALELIDGPWDVLSLQGVTPPSGLEGNAFPVGPRQRYVGTCNLQLRSAVVVHADILPYSCKVHTDTPHPAVTISCPGFYRSQLFQHIFHTRPLPPTT